MDNKIIQPMTYRQYIEARYGLEQLMFRRWAIVSSVVTIVAVGAFAGMGLLRQLDEPEDGFILALIAVIILASGASLLCGLHKWTLSLAGAIYSRVSHERLWYIYKHQMDAGRNKWETLTKEQSEQLNESLEIVKRSISALAAKAKLQAPVIDGFESLKTFIGDLRLFGRSCGYCGHFNAPVLCNACRSIQWGDLGPTNLTEVLPPWDWRNAVFLAEHRFPILNLVWTSMAIGLIAVTGAAILRSRDNAQARRRAISESTQNVIVASAGFRGDIVNLEQKCPQEMQRSDICIRLQEDFMHHYLSFSWLAIPALRDIYRERCKNRLKSDFGFAHACERMRDPDRLVDDVDKLYREYLYGLSGVATVRERRLAAYNLYTAGKGPMCLIAYVWWDTMDKDGACALHLKPNAWKTETELPDCKAQWWKCSLDAGESAFPQPARPGAYWQKEGDQWPDP